MKQERENIKREEEADEKRVAVIQARVRGKQARMRMASAAKLVIKTRRMAGLGHLSKPTMCPRCGEVSKFDLQARMHARECDAKASAVDREVRLALSFCSHFSLTFPRALGSFSVGNGRAGGAARAPRCMAPGALRCGDGGGRSAGLRARRARGLCAGEFFSLLFTFSLIFSEFSRFFAQPPGRHPVQNAQIRCELESTGVRFQRNSPHFSGVLPRSFLSSADFR